MVSSAQQESEPLISTSVDLDLDEGDTTTTITTTTVTNEAGLAQANNVQVPSPLGHNVPSNSTTSATLETSSSSSITSPYKVFPSSSKPSTSSSYRNGSVNVPLGVPSKRLANGSLGNSSGVNSQSSSWSHSSSFHPVPPSQENFVRVIERNIDYIKEKFDEFCSTQNTPGSSLFVSVISGTILVLYIINTIAWSLNESNAASISSSSSSLPADAASIHGSSNTGVDPAFDQHLPVLVKWLTISPGDLLIPYNWLWTGLSILTYPFIELYFYQVLIDIIVVTLSCTLIDPLWGRRELVRFFLVVNVTVGILSTAHYILIYAAKGDAIYLYGVTIYGLTGYLAAVCVSVKQLLPDSVVFSTALFKFKNNHIPLASFIFSWILYILNLTSGVSVITLFYGLIVSWIYLRFIQFHPTNRTRGDLSDGFSFYTFFPNVLQPLVFLISTLVYSAAVKCKIIPNYASTNSPQYASVRMLSERLTDKFKIPNSMRKSHKYHPSGDYEHLTTLQTSQSHSSIDI